MFASWLRNLPKSLPYSVFSKDLWVSEEKSRLQSWPSSTVWRSIDWARTIIPCWKLCGLDVLWGKCFIFKIEHKSTFISFTIFTADYVIKAINTRHKIAPDKLNRWIIKAHKRIVCFFIFAAWKLTVTRKSTQNFLMLDPFQLRIRTVLTSELFFFSVEPLSNCFSEDEARSFQGFAKSK